MPFTRLVRVTDAGALAELVVRNREFMAPTSPDRDDDFYTVEGQARVIDAALAEHRTGTRLPHVILDDDGVVVGRAALNEIVRGPLQSASLGYFVDERHNGRGLASRATAALVSIAFAELGLRRVQAGTQPDNLPSQRVLIKNGFRQYGYAPEYLKIAGEWRDELLFQRLATDGVDEPPRPA